MIVIGIDPGATLGVAVLADGRTVRETLTTRDLDAVLTHVRLEAKPLPGLPSWPIVVAIESAKSIYPRAGFTSRMATLLAAQQRQVGILAATAQELGCAVLEVECREWRKQLCGKMNAGDTAVSSALMLARLLPKRSNPHTRDAIGVARHGWLWATRTDEGRAAVEMARAKQWD